MPDLSGTVALVTGASRGVGKGVALGLCEAGATVYVTGRTSDDSSPHRAGTLHQTVEDARALGGDCTAIQCDHRNDRDVEGVFTRIAQDQGRLDVLVNSVWGGYEDMVEDGELTRSTDTAL